MSITFTSYPEAPITGYTINFWCDMEPVKAPQRNDALKIIDSHICEDCSMYNGPLLDENKIVQDVQMSNSNAINVMKHIGLEPEYFGSINAADFKLLVEKMIEKNNKSSIIDDNVIYLKNKLEKLHNLSIWADSNSAQISWG